MNQNPLTAQNAILFSGELFKLTNPLFITKLQIGCEIHRAVQRAALIIMEISEITMNEAEWQLLMIRLREFANYIDLIQQFIKQDVNNN